MKRIAMLAALLAGCTPTPSAETVAEAGAGQCDANAAQSFVGRALDAALPDAARTAAGARAVRVIRLGDAVTMDFRTDRLNVELDADGKVAKLRCG